MRLLLIEHNLENAQFFTLVFNTAGYEVVHQTHGLEGLKTARQEQFDAILITQLKIKLERLSCFAIILRDYFTSENVDIKMFRAIIVGTNDGHVVDPVDLQHGLKYVFSEKPFSL